MARILALFLALSLSSCAMTTLNADTTPRIGWSAKRVEQTLGLSYDVTAFATGYEVWRYSVAPGTSWVSGGCTSRYTRNCMAVYIQDGRVIDIKYP